MDTQKVVLASLGYSTSSPGSSLVQQKQAPGRKDTSAAKKKQNNQPITIQLPERQWEKIETSVKDRGGQYKQHPIRKKNSKY